MYIQFQSGNRILIFFFLLFFPGLSWCADAIGAKYFRNYSREEYNSQPQNWFLVQDKRGFIYSANQGSLLEYDGVSWKEILIPDKNVRSLAEDNTGTLYIGGNNEIGYLEPDNTGEYRYVTLTHLIETQYRDFSYVWRTYACKDGIYFCTTPFLFRFHRDRIKVWKADTSFSPPFLSGGRLLVRQQGQGLMEMSEGNIRLLPGGQTFADKKIYAIVEYSPGTLLIGTSGHGFFLYKNGTPIPFNTGSLDFVSANQLTYGLRLTDGSFAFATVKGGLFIIDKQGQLRLHFDTAMGLPDNTIWHILEDSGQNLWLALNNGISKLEYRSSFSFYDTRQGLEGMVFCAARFGPGNRLYAGTISGLFVMKENGIFVPIVGIPGACHALLPFENTLLAATERGIFSVTGTHNTAKVFGDVPVYTFQLTGTDRFPILAGTGRGLVYLTLDEPTGLWKANTFAEDINEEIRTFARDPIGNLWLGSPKQGVINISLPSTPDIDLHTGTIIQRYPLSLFPSGVETHVFYAAGHIIVATGKGIFLWNEKQAQFVPDFTLGDDFAGGKNGKSVFRITEDKDKTIWFHSNGRNLAAIPRPGQSYRIYNEEFLRIPLNRVESIYPDPLGETVWFASVDGLIRLDGLTRLEQRTSAPFRTFIRGAWANETFVPGSAAAGLSNPDAETLPELPFKRRSLRFAFTAPFFEAEENTRYQCRLDDYENHWTTWNKEPHKEYTNLEPGLNVFRVRAKNVYGRISEEAVFRFKLLPPWYRTWWAYGLYILLTGLLLVSIIRWRSASLVREKERLEEVVRKRTRQLETQAGQLEEQARQLQEMDKIKSRFFANISHEFRTPLTLIMGPLEQISAGAAAMNPRQIEDYSDMMLRNSRRLLNLINQLLDLAKFGGGKMKLRASRRDIIPFLQQIVDSFLWTAKQKKVSLSLQSGENAVELYFDGEQMEMVFYNLLANALNHTPANGSVTVGVKRINDSPDILNITVTDTGTGIPDGQMAYIFDYLFQVARPESESGNIPRGSGIGLALTREIIQLHGGTIDVSSRVGKNSGTTFTIQLPLGNAHLTPEQMVEAGGSPVTLMAPEAAVAAVDISPPDPSVESESGEMFINGEQQVVLVVEDNADLRRFMRRSLEPGYRVLEAPDGKKGVEATRKHHPDIIISDIMMPGMDGFELCRVLKTDVATSHIPIILLTARSQEESVIQGLECGADDYITKPFNTPILMARVKNLVDLRRQLHEKYQREMMMQPAEIQVTSVDRTFLEDLHKAVEANLSDPEFNINRLADLLYLSRATLNRKIRALTGESANRYIQVYRLKRGAQLLKGNFGNVTQVAFEVGFSSSPYFAKCFKEIFHQSPQSYQASQSN